MAKQGGTQSLRDLLSGLEGARRKVGVATPTPAPMRPRATTVDVHRAKIHAKKTKLANTPASLSNTSDVKAQFKRFAEQLSEQQALLEATGDECSRGIDDITAHVHLQHDQVSSMVAGFHSMSEMAGRLIEEVGLAREEQKVVSRHCEALEERLKNTQNELQTELRHQASLTQQSLVDRASEAKLHEEQLRHDMRGEMESLRSELAATRTEVKLLQSQLQGQMAQMSHDLTHEVAGLSSQTKAQETALGNTKVFLADGLSEMRDVTNRLSEALNLERRERQGEVELLKAGKTHMEVSMTSNIAKVQKEEATARLVLTDRLGEAPLTL